MMSPFSSLLTGTASASGGSARKSAQATSDANAAHDRFDRLLQSNSRADTAKSGGTRTEASRPDPQTRTREADAAKADQPKPDASQAKDGKARAEQARDAEKEPAGSAAERPDAQASASESSDAKAPDAPGDGGSSADAAPAPADDHGSATLPAQLLALLNGLAPAASATAAVTTDADAALPGSLAGTSVLPAPTTATEAQATTPMALLRAQAASQPGSAGADAATTGEVGAFAQMLGQLAGAGAGADADSAAATAGSTIDAPAIGDIEPATLPSMPAPVGATSARAATPAAAAQGPVALDSGFDEGIGSRIAWLAEQRIGHAEIRVSPDHLGTIDVRLQLDGNRVNAEFSSAQPEVRHALESSLPRLREMLGQHGLQLGNADVGQRQGGGSAQAGSQAADNAQGEPAADSAWTSRPVARATRGLLDEYA